MSAKRQQHAEFKERQIPLELNILTSANLVIKRNCRKMPLWNAPVIGAGSWQAIPSHTEIWKKACVARFIRSAVTAERKMLKAGQEKYNPAISGE
jgi:hypothetical protein